MGSETTTEENVLKRSTLKNGTMPCWRRESNTRPTRNKVRFSQEVEVLEFLPIEQDFGSSDVEDSDVISANTCPHVKRTPTKRETSTVIVCTVCVLAVAVTFWYQWLLS